MANPNIVNVTTITGKTAVATATTSSSAIVTNTAGSGKIFKINTLIVANTDGTNAVDLTFDLYRSSVAYNLGSTISIPADSSLIALSKDTAIYLEEGDALRIVASAASKLTAVCSYEEIS